MKHQIAFPKFMWIPFLLLLLSLFSPPSAQGQSEIVQSILFYSPTCPHCQKVITETLPPLVKDFGGTPETRYIPPTPEEESYGPPMIGMYGEILQILYINTMTELGQTLYREAIEHYQIPQDHQVVPLMIINDLILIGGNEIPNRFSEQVNLGIAAGGVAWPDLEGLDAAIASMIELPSSDQPGEDPTTQGETPEAAPGEISPEATTTSDGAPPSGILVPVDTVELTMLERIQLDPLGNGVAILVLLGMIAALWAVGKRISQAPAKLERKKSSILIPILSVIGMVVAGYLTYIETTGELAVCGPVGDCNTVQQSQYAMLFGLLPVGLLGFLGYIAITIAWLLSRFTQRPISIWADTVLFVMTTFGLFFSIYLTFLEPFVIGATCAWCLSSAIVITIMFWLSQDNAKIAFQLFRDQ